MTYRYGETIPACGHRFCSMLVCRFPIEAPQDALARKGGDRIVEAAETLRPEKEIGVLVTSGMERPTQLLDADTSRVITVVGCDERENASTTPADASPLNEYSNSHHGLPEEEEEEGTDDDAYNDPRTGQARDINRRYR